MHVHYHEPWLRREPEAAGRPEKLLSSHLNAGSQMWRDRVFQHKTSNFLLATASRGVARFSAAELPLFKAIMGRVVKVSF